ncbi:MAG: 4Fe-4S binding protein, partial [Alphaproteobacteria bacterium]
MKINGKKALICDCQGTIPLDGNALAKAFGGDAPKIANQLCRARIGEFQRAVLDGRPMLVACTQETPLFDEVLAETADGTQIVYANIREQAGWSVEGGEAAPKIAALLAEATLDVPKAPTVTMKSEGVVAIHGTDERAIEAAKQLVGRLDVVVFLDDSKGVTPPSLMDVRVFKGTIKAASGHLGAFEIIVDNFAAARPSSRRELIFEPPTNGKDWTCDLILDITGGAPLFPAPKKREGYFNPDPNDPVSVQRAIFDLANLVGEFEKPLYIDFDHAVCAHSRATLTGCTRCLDVCPTGAIEPAGNHVSIDPYVCAGCGNCAAVCPTGAASYAIPAGNALFERLRTLVGTFHKAGAAEQPVLLVHDGRRGIETIDMIARLGRGLPARVLPFAVNEVTQIGFDFF